MYVGAAGAYREALLGLIALLRRAGERDWRRWLEQDVTNWDMGAGVRHHLQAYGGLGSLSDLTLRAAHRHKVRPDQEPWVNACLSELLDIAGRAARALEHTGATPDTVIPLVSRTEVPDVEGWKCRACGLLYLHREPLTEAAARWWAGAAVPAAVSEGRGAALARRAFEPHADVECGVFLDELNLAAAALDLPHLDQRFAWRSDPCPRCAGRDWARCRWRVKRAPLRLVE